MQDPDVIDDRDIAKRPWAYLVCKPLPSGSTPHGRHETAPDRPGPKHLLPARGRVKTCRGVKHSGPCPQDRANFVTNKGDRLADPAALESAHPERPGPVFFC